MSIADLFKDNKRKWDLNSRVDPLWSILSDPTKHGRKWNPDEFYQTGVDEIKYVMAHINDIGIKLNNNRALDFGCGVGRLTYALAPYFKSVQGIDVSQKMVDLAGANRRADNCDFLLNASPNLDIIQSNRYDLILSLIVLQHIPHEVSKIYFSQMLELLSDGGVAYLQVPIKTNRLDAKPPLMATRSLKDRLPVTLLALLRRIRRPSRPVIELDMHCYSEAWIEETARKHGCSIVDRRTDHASGEGHVSVRYVIRKTPKSI